MLSYKGRNNCYNILGCWVLRYTTPVHVQCSYALHISSNWLKSANTVSNSMTLNRCTACRQFPSTAQNHLQKHPLKPLLQFMSEKKKKCLAICDIPKVSSITDLGQDTMSSHGASQQQSFHILRQDCHAFTSSLLAQATMGPSLATTGPSGHYKYPGCLACDSKFYARDSVLFSVVPEILN